MGKGVDQSWESRQAQAKNPKCGEYGKVSGKQSGEVKGSEGKNVQVRKK